MPNQYIIDYLKRNKNKFSLEVLKEKLVKTGYPIDQIEEAAQLVYKAVLAPQEIPETPFWDFWHKKVYSSGKEKLIDFIVGFIFAIVLTYDGFYIVGFGVEFIEILLGGFEFYGFFLLFMIFLAILIHFFRTRKYIAFGIICGIVLSFIFPMPRLYYMFY